jgi:hypothetical protein
MRAMGGRWGRAARRPDGDRRAVRARQGGAPPSSDPVCHVIDCDTLLLFQQVLVSSGWENVLHNHLVGPLIRRLFKAGEVLVEQLCVGDGRHRDITEP